MRLGAGVFMLASGAILAFAVQDRINGVDLSAVGWILIAVGALALVLAIASQRRRTTIVSTDGRPPIAPAGVSRQEIHEDAMMV